MVKQGPETTGNQRSEPLNKCPALGNEGHLEAREHRALQGPENWPVSLRGKWLSKCDFLQCLCLLKLETPALLDTSTATASLPPCSC